MGKTIAQKIFDITWRARPDARHLHVIRWMPSSAMKSPPRQPSWTWWPGAKTGYSTRRIKAVIDHVTPAKDWQTALQGKILRDWARRHGIADFFDIGANGVCHALFPEKGFVRPGYTIIMGDSHTCTHGAFGAFAAGVGTTDLEVGILKGVCAFRYPDPPLK
jgi:3-isopropylmalate/(R)-2-methylmalate dehydratase large subunit